MDKLYKKFVIFLSYCFIFTVNYYHIIIITECRSCLAEKEKQTVVCKPCTATHIFSSGGIGRESESQNWAKSEAETSCFIHKAKAARASQKKASNQFTTSHGQAGVQSCLEKHGSITCHSSWEDKHVNSELPPIPSPFLADMMSMTLHGMEYPFCGSALLCPLPNPRASPAHMQMGWGEKHKSL